MNTRILTLLILLIFSVFRITWGQVKDDFNDANEALRKGEYSKADSLYSLCVDKSLNGDIYYNRATCRLMMKDTCGYCEDLRSASFDFFDKEAEKEYYQGCVNRIDTLFYTKEFIKVDKSKSYRYYEVFTEPHCDTLKYFDFHDKRKKRKISAINLNNLSGALEGSSTYIDFAGKAYFADTNKIFYYIQNVFMNNIIEHSNYQLCRKFSLYLSKKYDQLKKYETESIRIRILINQYGKIVNYKFIGNARFNKNHPNFKELDTDTRNFIKEIQILKPVLFLNKPVSYEADYIVKF